MLPELLPLLDPLLDPLLLPELLPLLDPLLLPEEPDELLLWCAPELDPLDDPLECPPEEDPPASSADASPLASSPGLSESLPEPGPTKLPPEPAEQAGPAAARPRSSMQTPGEMAPSSRFTEASRRGWARSTERRALPDAAQYSARAPFAQPNTQSLTIIEQRRKTAYEIGSPIVAICTLERTFPL
jgi:hypothetical protein